MLLQCPCGGVVRCNGGLAVGRDAKTDLVPDAWNTFQRVEFIAAMIEGDTRHARDNSRKRELLWLERVVQLPSPDEVFEPRTFNDPDGCSGRIFFLIDTSASTHFVAPYG
jgi:hypothetical protein